MVFTRVRAVLFVAVFFVLPVAWAGGFLAGVPSLDRPHAASGPRHAVLERAVPVRVRAASASGGDPWVLFDGDTASALESAGTSAVGLLVQLDRPVDLRAVSVFAGRGRLTLAARLDAGSAAATETGDLPVATLDLDAPGRAGGAGWRRFALAETWAAARWTLEWQPPDGGGRLPEIELWGRSGPTTALRAENPRREIVATPETGADPARFRWHLDGDPARFERAFLVYEIHGLADGASALRSLNGLPPSGGHGATAADGTRRVVEEISPAWLRRGDNQVVFSAVRSGGETPDDVADLRWRTTAGLNAAGAELPYGVRGLRLLLLAEDGRPLVTESATSWGPSATAAALVDGDPATGWQGESDPANDLAATVDLPFEDAAQPTSLELTFDAPPAGRLWAEALLAGGGSRPAAAPLDLTNLAAGWNEVVLDADLPAAIGLRLTWTGAAAGRGRLLEADAVASPVGGAGGRPRIVVSVLRPDSRGAYLRGFVTPPPGVGTAVELYVDGANVPGAVGSQDGAFEVFLPRTEPAATTAGARPDSRRDVEVLAVFADGSRVSRRLSLDDAADREDGDPDDPASDPETRREVRRSARPGAGLDLELAGARLSVDETAVGREVTLSMRPLARPELPALDSGMYNVTAPHVGFRMGPHGMKFEHPVRLELPFDPELLPAGTTADDVRTFYFNESSGRWVALPRLVVDTAELRVVSATDHFTDFVNAVLVAPDEPGEPGFTPNSMTGWETADPASGLTLVAAPEASSAGDAQLAFPLAVPPGRRGVEPSLALVYDSGGGNGWLGLGWDLPLPSIEVSTLFGVPRYDRRRESESYLLDGTFLAPEARGTGGGPRRAERQFAQRVEGAFARIVRHGDAPDAYWWEVTGKDGTRYLYGRTAQARLASPRSPGDVFRWYLETVVDLNGNTMGFEYRRDSGTEGEDWVQLYPRRITYTGGPDLAPFYEVRFLLDDEVGAAPREDRLSSGLPGFKVYTRRRLQRVEVAAGGLVVRAYDLVYTRGAFAKTLLSEIVARGEGGEVEFFRHRFDYAPLPRWSEDEVDGFSGPQPWGRLDADDDQSDHLEIGGGFHAFVGLGPVGCATHAGIQGGFSVADDTLRLGLLDVDGDGLPDRLREDGRTELNSLPGGFTGGSRSVDGADALGHTQTWAFDFGVGAHGLAELGQLSANWVWTHANDDRAVADVDGDLRADLLSTAGGELTWSRNTGDGFAAARVLSGFSLDGLDLTADGEEEEMAASFHPTDTLLKLKLPYAGEIVLSGALRKKQAGGDGVVASVYHGDDLLWRRAFAADDLAPCTPGDGGGCGAGLHLSVDAGDELYFRSGVGDDSEHDTLEWAPAVRYETTVADGPVTSALRSRREAWGAPVYDFDQAADFRLAGRPDGGWVATAAGRVAVLGEVSKQPTADDLVLSIERGGERIFEQLLPAADAGSFSPQVGLLDVEPADALVFRLESASQVDPDRVAWQPVVTYEGGEYCRQPLDGGAPACGAVSCGADGDCTLAGDPTPTLPLRREEIRRAASVRTQVHDGAAVSGPTHATPAPSGGGPFDLGIAWKSSDGYHGSATLLIQGKHELFRRCTVAAGSLRTCLAQDISLAPGEPVYFTVVDADPGSLSAASLDGVTVATDHRVEIPDAEDPLSGGYHGWFYGEWDGSRELDLAAFSKSRVKQRAEDMLAPEWTAAAPAPEGTADHPGPAWVGSGDGFYLAAGEVRPARFGSSYGSRLREANGETGEGASMLRKTTGRTAAVSAGLFVGAALSLGSADTQLDLLDMNADGYVDQVSSGTVRFSDGAHGFGAAEGVDGLAGAVRRVEDASLTNSLGIGVPYSVKSGSAVARALASTAPSVGQTTSLSQVRSDLVDVNGDGLPDRVELGPDAPRDGAGRLVLRVRLNLGYRFGEVEEWPMPAWSEPQQPRCSEGLDFVAAPVLDAIAGVDDPNALSLTRSAAYDVGLALGYFGGGANTSLSRTLVELVDVNGDGLVDHVSKDDGDDFFRVKLNLGDRWGAEERWHAPDWSTSLGDGYDPDVSLAGVDVFNCFDAVSLYGHLGGEGSLGVPLCIPLVPPAPVAGLQLELAGQVSGGEGGLQLDLQDVDGDGLLDHVLKKGGDGSVYVRRNQVGETNLLKTVHRPLGGRIDLTYRRQGNRVETVSDGAAEHRVDLPFHRWVLAGSVVHDGRGNSYETRFDYFNDGFYDRGERVFYGFRHVRTTLPDGSHRDDFFHNDDFYTRGLPLRESVADAAGHLFRVDEWRYEERPVRGELTDAAVFPALVEEATYLYDGTSADPSSFGKATRVVYDYDAAGNVVSVHDFADEGSDDDSVATTAYAFDPVTWLTQPSRHEVRDHAGRLLRRQRFTYDARGNLTSLAATLDGGRDPDTGAPYAGATATWSWTYDARGMRRSATDPSGYTTETTWDGLTGSYPVAGRDSFGYTTSARWNLAHGVPLATTDANGNSTRYAYDAFGRLVRVTGPYDDESSPLLAYEYAPDASPPFAVVHHKDVTRGDPLDASVFIDALGRVLQIKQDVEIDRGTGTAGRVGMQVLGGAEFDAKGRLAALGQPFFDDGAPQVFVSHPLVRPTRYEYDAVDRVLATRYPHGGTTRLRYGFAPLDGVGRLAVDRFDANGRRTRSYLHVDGAVLAVEQTRDGRALRTRYAYDPLSQLTSITDAAGNVTTVELDTLGRRVVVDQPDAGRRELRWTRAGDLGAEISARHAAAGEQIRYRRTFHRLDRVDYPHKTDAVLTWGAPGAPHNGAGRLLRVDDESGSEETVYGRRGEVVKTVKTATALNGDSPQGPFELTYELDSFDRLLAMVYPDGERLEYGFDAGGRVKSAVGSLRGRRYEYLRHLGYDEFGQPVRITYGNGVETTVSYDPDTRFASRQRTRSGGRELQDLAFHHDAVGTLLGVDNDVPVPRPSQLGGPSSQSFAYDDLYQLVAASGTFRSAPNKTSRYALALAYDDVGNLTAKSRHHELVQPGGPAVEQRKTSYEWSLEYAGPQPHAPSRVGDRAFLYDADGNQLGWDDTTNGTRRRITWDDDGRVASVADNGRTTRYLYDAGGLRTNKAGPDGETIYVHRYFSLRNGALGSKHVFADDHRLASKLGQPALPAGGGGAPGKGQGNGNGKGKGAGGSGANGGGSGQPVEDKLYFYHGDQVGSTQFVTDADGDVYQHLETFPQGELWVDERSESERTPYTFAAQELDEETGLQCIGARYYDPRQGQWLSPDPSYEGMLDPGSLPVADPSLAPFRLPGHMYAYAANSPTSLLDGTGLAWWTRTAYHAHNLYRAGIESVRYGRLVSPLEARSLELHDLLAYNADGTQDFTAYDRRTTAVVATREGTYYVAQSGESASRLDKRIRSALWEGIEREATGRGHGEPTAIRQAIASADHPTAVAASRDICPDCQRWLSRHHPNIEAVSPREGDDVPRPDRWGRGPRASQGSGWRQQNALDGPANRTRANSWNRDRGRLRPRGSSPARRAARGASPARR